MQECIDDTENVSSAIRSDLKLLKYTLRSTLFEYVDDFAFRILSNIDRDME